MKTHSRTGSTSVGPLAVISVIRFALLIGLAILAGVCPATAEIEDVHWTLGPDFPHLRKGGALGVVDGKIIAACGMQQPWREAESAYLLDFADPSGWARLPDRPVGRCYVQGVGLGDSLYVVGGRLEGKTRTDGHRLTLRGGTWTWRPLPPLGQHRGWAPVVALGSRLLAVGGFAVEDWGGRLASTLHSIEMMDTAAAEPAWKELTRIPGKSRGWLSAAAVGGKLYLFGGSEVVWRGPDARRREPLDEVAVFDPADSSWRTLPPLPFCLSGSDCIVYEDRYVLVFGGACPAYPAELQRRKEAIEGHEHYYNPFVLVYDTQQPGCRVLPSPMPYPTNDIRAVGIGSTVLTLAGENIEKATSNTTRWVRIGTIVEATP